MILEGLHKLKDFKSIIYKHNELNALAIAKLQPIFIKKVPNHLQELQIIDCKIHCVQIEEMLDLMASECQINHFALVNVHHSDASFSKLCEYVTESHRLRELNVSWQCLRPSAFAQFLRVIRDNRFLVNLTIAWNKLIEDQPTALTEK